MRVWYRSTGRGRHQIAARINPRNSVSFLSGFGKESADFPERESDDMLGIADDNHPRRQRILMPGG